MSIVNVISAIGNNNSVYPLLVRDCGIENPVKVALTYNQNKEDKNIAKLATRERFFDEYVTSAVWLGVIPLLEKVSDKVIAKKGFNPVVSLKLQKEEACQGLEYNIKKFKNLAPDAVKDLEFLKNNSAKYKKLLGKKVLAETAIPIALMGVVIPKVLFAWTARTKKELSSDGKIVPNKDRNNLQENRKQISFGNVKSFDEFRKSKGEELAFKGGLVSSLADLSTVSKMALTDGGYAAGRLATARKKNEAIDIGFKMAGMMYLNFLFPKQLAKFLDKTSGALAGSNLNLDIKMFNDKDFITSIKEGKLGVPDIKTEKELLDFVDNNPKNMFVQYANKYKKVTLLENGVRDPRKYVDLKGLMKFKDDILDVSKKAVASGDVTKFMKKAKVIKGANILANVGISSFLLAYALPKAQFAFRQVVTGSGFEPGIVD